MEPFSEHRVGCVRLGRLEDMASGGRNDHLKTATIVFQDSVLLKMKVMPAKWAKSILIGEPKLEFLNENGLIGAAWKQRTGHGSQLLLSIPIVIRTMTLAVQSSASMRLRLDRFH